MKEIFDARARALAGRGTGSKHGPTERVLVCEIGSQRWALPCDAMETVVEATPLDCPAGVSWRKYPCIGFLCWEVTVFPVVDFAQVLEPRAPKNSVDYLYALLRNPDLSLRLPRATTLTEICVDGRKPCDHPCAKARLDDINVLDWECL